MATKIEYLDGKRLYGTIGLGIKNLIAHQQTLDEIHWSLKSKFVCGPNHTLVDETKLEIL